MADTEVPVAPDNRRIVVIGASAGGLQPLQQLLAALPVDLPAALFVVVHLGASSHLVEVLSRTSRLPVVGAHSGLKIATGRVYVGVPDAHMLIHDRHLLLRRGPRENCARPAIDPLFRSAACSYGGAVIGVVLSGALNDGTAGLRAIKRCGGLAVVQDPDDAAVSSMPASAMRAVAADFCGPAQELGRSIARLVREPAGVTPPIPADIRLETAIAAQELAGMDAEDALGRPSRFTCPECHGALWEVDDTLLRYRCHVGHAYTGEAIAAAQAQAFETTLWNLMRMQQQRAELARQMAGREIALNRPQLAKSLEQRAVDYEEDAEVMKRLIRYRSDVISDAIAEPGEQGGL